MRLKAILLKCLGFISLTEMFFPTQFQFLVTVELTVIYLNSNNCCGRLSAVEYILLVNFLID